MPETWQLPRSDERTAVIGQTGSGKTRMASFLLSYANYDRMPWVVIDFKGEKLFNGVKNLVDIGLNTIPQRPGLYRLKVRPDQGEAFEDWMWRVHATENIGLYFDETYQVPGHNRLGAFASILVQGRSKQIPCILCTQRPARVSTSMFSEADHFSVFYLGRDADIKTVEGFTPDKLRLRRPLPRFHSRWYDVKRNTDFTLSPVEDDAAILGRFNNRLRSKTKFL